MYRYVCQCCAKLVEVESNPIPEHAEYELCKGCFVLRTGPLNKRKGDFLKRNLNENFYIMDNEERFKKLCHIAKYDPGWASSYLDWIDDQHPPVRWTIFVDSCFYALKSEF